MSNQSRHSHTSREQSCTDRRNFESLTAPKYLEPIDAIVSQRLISSLRSPAAFTISKGFIVSSPSEAVRALERFISFERKLINEEGFRSCLAALNNLSRDALTIEFPQTLLSSRPLLNYYRSCTITPLGTSQLALQFGDGVISHELHTYMNLPALVVAERRCFHLEPIPGTRGAKAFSPDAGTLLLAKRLRSLSQITVRDSFPKITFSLNNEEFEISFNLFCYRNGSDHYHEDLVIFPCSGIDIPWHLRERLTISVAPALAPHNETTRDLSSQTSQLSAAASIVTSSLEELFGLHSNSRLKSIAPISEEDVEALRKYQARTMP
jgi:hypothetical protein